MMAVGQNGVSSSAPKKGAQKWWQRWFHLATGFDMQFFILLMMILIIGLATL